MHQNKRPKRYYVMHSTERPFLCSQYGKSFCIEYQLYRPKIIHTGCVRMLVCIAPWALYSHAAFAAFTAEAQWCTNPRHVASQKIKNHRYRCTECGIRFDCASQLEILHGMHTGERPYDCPQCQKRSLRIICWQFLFLLIKYVDDIDMLY